jgi:hypothetical protein
LFSWIGYSATRSLSSLFLPRNVSLAISFACASALLLTPRYQGI